MNRFLYLLGFSIYGIISVSVLVAASFFYKSNEIGLLSIVIAFQYYIAQIIGLGLNYSALYFESIPSNVNHSRRRLFNVLIVSFIFSVILFPFYDTLFHIFSNYSFEDIKYYLFFYGILISSNKVFLAIINAKRNYAKLGLIFIFKSLFTFFGAGFILYNQLLIANYVVFCYLLPEIFVFLILILNLLSPKNGERINGFKPILIQDLKYGLKSFWGAFLLEASTKLDVLMIAYYNGVELSGVYGLIAVFSDIVFQLSTLLRSYFNPIITMSFYQKDLNDFKSFFNKNLKSAYLIISPAILILGITSFLSIINISNLENYIVGIPILFFFVVVYFFMSGYFITFQFFNQIGKPLVQSNLFLILFLSNLILNFILVPTFNMYGAVIATGISNFIYIFMFNYRFNRL